jgi:hypothetical protein
MRANLTDSPREMRNQLHEREIQEYVGTSHDIGRYSELAQCIAARTSAVTADAARLAVVGHPEIQGPCVECGRQTGSIVRSSGKRAEFLCPPCGKTMREAI